MRIRTKKRSSSEIDVSAFADIAFLLIIFFILTTTFVRHQGTRLDVPAGTQDESEAAEENPTVNLSSQQIVFRNKTVTLDALRRELQAMELPEQPEDDRIVVLESAEDVPYEIYFQVVAAITDAGGVLAVMEKEGEDG